MVMHVTTTVSLLLAMCALARSEPEAPLDPLDQNVFKSLEETALDDLNDTFTDNRVTMDFFLTQNMIEEVFTPSGEFDLEGLTLMAHLPETRGTLTGNYRVIIRVPRGPRKAEEIRLQAAGAYVAKVHHVDLKINISLPIPPAKKMGLKGCHGVISDLHLTLTTKNEDEKGLLVNLKEHLLTKAMKKGFAGLFCDTMAKILQEGTESPIVIALQNRLCKISGGNCES